MFRYQGISKYAAIGYDQWNGWTWHMSGKWGKLNVHTPGMEIGVPVKMRVEYEGAKITLYLNDEKVYEDAIPALDIGAGQMTGGGVHTDRGKKA